MPKVTIDNLDSEIQKILEEYSDEVNTRTGELVDQLARKGVQALKSSSPVKSGAPKSGSYARGWKVETTGKGHKQLMHNSTIYNSQPGLPHLLEHGHALRQGGRSPAIVHIQPVEDLLYSSIRPEDLA